MKKKLNDFLLKLRRSKFFKIFFSSFLIFGVLISSVVVPSSAADVCPSSLYGTSWKLDTFNCQAGLGYFDVSGICSLNSPETGDSFNKIGVGYYSFTENSVPSANQIIIQRPNTNDLSGFETSSFPKRTIYFYFTGGSDLSNPSLLNFICSNGVQVEYPTDPEPAPDPDPDPDPDPGDDPGNNPGDNPGGSFNNVIKKGYYYSSSVPLYTSSSISQNINFLSSGSDSPYSSISVNVSSNSLLSNITYGSTVVGQSSWIDFGYRLIYITEDTSVSYPFNVWFSSQFISCSGSSSSGAYNQGYSQGYSDGRAYGYKSGYDLGFDVGYDSGSMYGYDSGYEDGLNSSDSSNLGKNLLGDTLSAPMTALNSFVLYTTPSGVPISLGLVLGSVIALTFFIAFLKLFAGG